MLENLLIWFNSFEISKNIGTSLDIATAISIIATALIYIRNQKKSSYEAIQRKHKEIEDMTIIQKKESEKLRKQRISEQGCSSLITEISNLSSCYEKIRLDSNNIYRIISPLTIQNEDYICLHHFKRIKDKNNKFQHIDFIYDNSNRENINNELKKFIISIHEKVNYLSSRIYVLMPVLDAITNDIKNQKDKEKILYELYEFHKSLSFVGYKINNWRIFWRKIWEIRDYIDSYKAQKTNNDRLYKIKEDDKLCLLEEEIINNINSLIYDERLKSIVDFTIGRISDEIELLERSIYKQLQEENKRRPNKDTVYSEIIYRILYRNNTLIFSNFVKSSTEYMIINIKNIEDIFHSLLSLLSSTYYYIINNNDGIDFQKIKDAYNSKLNINSILDIDIIQPNKELYSNSTKISLFRNALKFKKFIVREIESKGINYVMSNYNFNDNSMTEIQKWIKLFGIENLSKRLKVSKEEALDIINKINHSIPSREIEKEYNLQTNLNSINIRSIISNCRGDPSYQGDNAIDFIKNTIHILNKKLISEEDIASIQDIDINIIRNWVININHI